MDNIQSEKGPENYLNSNFSIASLENSELPSIEIFHCKEIKMRPDFNVNNVNAF